MLDRYCFTFNFGRDTNGSLYSHIVPISTVAARCAAERATLKRGGALTAHRPLDIVFVKMSP